MYIPIHFDIFDTAPVDTAALNTQRNLHHMKHLLMEANIWDSLTSNFKIEMNGSKSTAKLKIGEEYDGILL